MIAVRFVVGMQVVQIDPLIAQPLPVRSPSGKIVLDLFVRDQPPLFEIDQKDAARLEAALLLHVARLDLQHAHFAGHDHTVVVSQVISRRPQAVAVQDRPDVVAVGKGDRRRPVPGLHQAGVVFVKSPLVFGNRLMILPRLRNHHHHGFLQRAAGHQQEFQHVVEISRIAAIRFHNRKQLADLVPVQVAAHDPFTSMHPVRVAPQGVDFPVVAHEAVRLSPIPAGEGIGGESRVDHGQVRGEIGVGQVGIIGQELPRHQHALVNDDLGREAVDVKDLSLLQGRVPPQPMAGPLANDVQLTFKSVRVQAVGGGHEQLFNCRLGLQSRGADVGRPGIGGHLPPTDQPLTLLGNHLLDHLLAPQPLLFDRGQEDEPRGKLAGSGQVGGQVLPSHFSQELVRQGGQYPRPVARVGLATTRPPVVHVPQDLVRIQNDLMAPLPLDVRHETDAARIVLVRRIVQSLSNRAPGRPIRVHRVVHSCFHHPNLFP